MWNDNNKIIEVFEKATDGKTEYPCVCPICNNRAAHIYVHKHNDRHCGVWIWCSSCKSSSHLSGESPTWCKNPDFVDPAKLCANPEYLDQMKDQIDEWVNAIKPIQITKRDVPFTMENKYKVILKAELQGISAGTKGEIVIKDDFKTISVDFIESSGNVIHINTPPETILNIVEVIK